ncbi:MAG TPA: RsmD family RNA methyltransferase [Saprospiraceae bacterium]|nr:RsmD family RNA methyltransferase [Saprospiraceae bacterium]
MRITGGVLKGRIFNPPAKHWPTRPTTEIAREGLFNMLSNILDFESISMLDLFGGTGAHCYEMISRGCRNTLYVDKFPPAVQFARQTAEAFGITESMEIFRSDYEMFINTYNGHFDYIFAGPPYPLPKLDQIPDKIFSAGLLNEGGVLVLEHNPDWDFKDHVKYWKSRNYGQTIFTFFRA